MKIPTGFDLPIQSLPLQNMDTYILKVSLLTIIVNYLLPTPLSLTLTLNLIEAFGYYNVVGTWWGGGCREILPFFKDKFNNSFKIILCSSAIQTESSLNLPNVASTKRSVVNKETTLFVLNFD